MIERRPDRGSPDRFDLRDWDARDDERLKRDTSQISHLRFWFLALSMPDDEPQPSTDD